MHIAIAIPEDQVSPETLAGPLEALTRVNMHLVGQGAPTAAQAIRDGAVHWSPEPPGHERFDHAGLVLPRGWGDCDDLAPWHTASLRMTGVDPYAYTDAIRTGPSTFHAITRRGNGTIDDPSAWAGMPVPHPARAPVVRAINGGRAGVASVYRQDLGAWCARADMPISGILGNACLSGLAAGYCPEEAVEQAIHGVCGVATLAGVADPRNVEHLYEGLRRRGWGR